MVYVDDQPIFGRNLDVLNQIIKLTESIKHLYQVENLGPIS